MTIKQFEMHRPKLYRSLSEFLSDQWNEPNTDVSEWELGECDIQPSYWTDILFIAKFECLQKLVCLKAGHWAWDQDL